jgi:hypothetical protein
VKVTAMMKVGPSMRAEQASSSNNPNAAEIKSLGSERLGKRLYEIVM